MKKCDSNIIDLILQFTAPKYENVLADTPEKAKALNCRLGDIVSVRVEQEVVIFDFNKSCNRDDDKL